MHNTLFYIILGIIIVDFLLERWLDYLNGKKLSTELPEELRDVYDAEQYKKSQEYKKANDRFSLITSTFSFLLIIGMLLFNGFNMVDTWARSFTEHPVLVALIFFGILAIASDILNLPFTVYDIFIIEEKFGFNKTTPRTFVLDKIKSWFLGAVIGGGIISLIIWFYQQTTTSFWIYAWIAVSLFTVFMTMFYSTLIVPIFNKQTPLEEGELRNEIQQFSEKADFKLDNIYVIDGSKRSTKSNAYFAGFGSKKRIVLFDTLIRDLSNHEIVSVLAHEIGHYKKKHVLKGIVTSIIQTGITLFIFSLFVDNPQLSAALGSEKPSFHLGLIAFGILYSPISMVVGLFMNYFSRKHEYSADGFAKEKYNGEVLIRALKKLSSRNLSNLTPHPLYVFFHYSHPPLLQRIRALKQTHLIRDEEN
ncbi:MAG: M48 family metallopeptidase [Bacteroidales bacterium]|nr:M48 family metallopeptidase [Bacteroidales bacterium]MBN2762844.1 M48 family metallopeptidase [Bacteroidales bacterium]